VIGETVSTQGSTIDLGKLAVHGPIWASPCSFIRSTQGRDKCARTSDPYNMAGRDRLEDTGTIKL
jgi:hypothetical protein